MDVNDLYETLQTWLTIYNENIHKDEPDENKSEEQLKWETNMMKISAAFKVPEQLKDTPAKQHIEKIVQISLLKKTSMLKEIYRLCNELNEFLK